MGITPQFPVENRPSGACRAKSHKVLPKTTTNQSILVFINAETHVFYGILQKFFKNLLSKPAFFKSMEVFIERENARKKLKFSGKVSKLLKQLNLNPAAVLVAKNNSLVTEDDFLSDKDEVKILSVISGG